MRGHASPAKRASAAKNRKRGKEKADATDLAISQDAEVEARIAAYGLPDPTSWQEAKIKEQTRAEAYRTMGAAAELARMRGALVRREAMDEALEALRDALHRHCQAIPRAAADRLREIPPALRASVVEAIEQALSDAFAAAISEARNA